MDGYPLLVRREGVLAVTERGHYVHFGFEIHMQKIE